MMLPTAAQAMRYRDPNCEALLKQLGKGALFTQPVLLGFTGLPRLAQSARCRA
jgi:hypothetical protein